MKLTDEQIALLRLSLTDGVGPIIGRYLLEQAGSASLIYKTTKRELETKYDCSRRLIRLLFDNPNTEQLLEEQLNLLTKRANTSLPVNLISCTEEAFYPLLRHCTDAPLLLFYEGVLPPISSPMISVVGTRNCTVYSEDTLRYFFKRWAELAPDLVIVSGLAYGVDALAHRLALEYNLQTIAVVAHGLQTIYPSSHSSLARQIISAGGAIVSEYPLGTKPLPQRFIARNRIIAGLSTGVLVTESKERGGALVTARTAFEYGREVYAIPGRIFDSTSDGCNTLIARQQASIAIDPKRILEELNIIAPCSTQQKQSLPFDALDTETIENDKSSPILSLLGRYDSLTIDELSAQTGISSREISALLFELELSGRVRSHPGARYSFVHTKG